MGFFYARFKILRLPFPFFFCSPELTDELFRDTGYGSRFSAFTRNSSLVMKNQVSGTLNVPASGIPAVGESVNALTEQVNNLQRRYYRSVAPDCELRSASDRWYFGAILATCIGFIFPPLLAVTALCVYKAKKCRKGGAE